MFLVYEVKKGHDDKLVAKRPTCEEAATFARLYHLSTGKALYVTAQS